MCEPQQLVQSIWEGVAFRVAEVTNAMHSCVPMNSNLFIDDGMSKNPYFTQFLGNVMQREVRPASIP